MAIGCQIRGGLKRGDFLRSIAQRMKAWPGYCCGMRSILVCSTLVSLDEVESYSGYDL